MKKIMITSALSLALAVSAAGHSNAAAVFSDIKDSSAKEQIEALAAAGIVDGTADQVFMPEDVLLTSQGIALVARSMQLTAPTNGESKESNAASVTESKDPVAAPGTFFTAVDSGSWYGKYFAAVHSTGLELPADIAPAEAITKEAFVYYLVSAMEKSGGFPMIKLVPADIADEAELTPSYQGAVQRALHYRLVALDDKDNFNPAATLTRAEAASITHKAVELLNKQLELTKETAAAEPSSSERWMHVPEGVTPADNE
ncbi:MAG: amylopullulanase [Paenibacillaceae bacterium]|jgi:hypothetical protein|nr:amylopullulanase [Paenibacillaceae bacterium]